MWRFIAQDLGFLPIEDSFVLFGGYSPPVSRETSILRKRHDLSVTSVPSVEDLIPYPATKRLFPFDAYSVWEAVKARSNRPRDHG